MRSWALVCDVYFLAPQVGWWALLGTRMPRAGPAARQSCGRVPTACRLRRLPCPLQARRPGESAKEFAERVQRLIAAKGRLKVAPWDGYLKYYNLGEKVRLSQV